MHDLETKKLMDVQSKPAHFHQLRQRKHIHIFDRRVDESNVLPRNRGGSEDSHSTEARERYSG